MKQFRLGTAVKITTILSVDNPDSVKITIEDPSDIEKVSSASMTKEADGIYYYIWQSDEDNDDEGQYEATIKATKGSYTALSKIVFEMIE